MLYGPTNDCSCNLQYTYRCNHGNRCSRRGRRSWSWTRVGLAPRAPPSLPVTWGRKTTFCRCPRIVCACCWGVSCNMHLLGTHCCFYLLAWWEMHQLKYYFIALTHIYHNLSFSHLALFLLSIENLMLSHFP